MKSATEYPKRIARRYLLPSLRYSLYQVANEIRVAAAHSRGSRQARDLDQRSLRLNLGCGPNTRSGWVNIDLVAPGALPLDLRRELPFRNSTCELVYSEHFFEHLDYPEPASLHLREVFRVIEPGGTLSFGVPDAQAALNEYVTGEDTGFQYARDIGWHPAWCDTPMHQVNYLFRQAGEHKYAYDYRTLERMLADAGFADIERRDFDPAIDSEGRRLGTLYVQARKP